MYSVFLEEWLLAYREDSVLLVRAEDYMGAATHRATLQRVLDFTGLRASEQAAKEMDTSKVKPSGSRGTLAHHPRSFTMSAELRFAMTRFYQPFNDHLSQLTGDEQYSSWPVHNPLTTPAGYDH
jgi:hypothetical protein